VSRNCGTCTACCEGWLSGEAHGRKFYPGVKCHFLGERCTIYAKRPHDPCVTFRCEYLTDDNVPEWMKPERSGVILCRRERDGIAWLEVTEMGRKMDASVLNWLVLNVICKAQNIRYQIDGGWNYVGKPDFCALMAKV
jgi:uncharacterized cysteine cluster protein YcgN (CxxCxxCC family)